MIKKGEKKELKRKRVIAGILRRMDEIGIGIQRKLSRRTVPLLIK